mmetsp:Transcript_27692/g.57629  ORF Transcript_27692/g.57629 Transcript_27692/m.57629 type:complete len:206 (-) Transcript_27692:2053-2670(-)
MHLKLPLLARNVAQENRRVQGTEQALKFVLNAKEAHILPRRGQKHALRALQVHTQGMWRRSVLIARLDTSRTLQPQSAHLHAVPALLENFLHFLLLHAVTALLGPTHQLDRRCAPSAQPARTAQGQACLMFHSNAKIVCQEHFHWLDSQHVLYVQVGKLVLWTKQVPVQTVQEERTQKMWVDQHVQLALLDHIQARVRLDVRFAA